MTSEQYTEVSKLRVSNGFKTEFSTQSRAQFSVLCYLPKFFRSLEELKTGCPMGTQYANDLVLIVESVQVFRKKIPNVEAKFKIGLQVNQIKTKKFYLRMKTEHYCHLGSRYT